jgi:hypothetical protein
MTFDFHPVHDPYNLPNTHSFPPNPPSITAPTSLHDPAFPANYDWGLAPTTLSPAEYGPPAGFHHGDDTHGQPLDVHLPEASSLLFGSYAPPLEVSQLSPSSILRHDTYESVLGNAFNPVAPTRLAPQTQAPISLPTLDFPCLAPAPSLPAQADPPAPAPVAEPVLASDPLQSNSSPGRPAFSTRASKRKRKRSTSLTASQPQADLGGLSSSITTATPKSPSTTKAMSGYPSLGRGGGQSRMGPPPVPPQPGRPQRSPPSSGIHQQPQAGYPAVPVGMDERYPKRRRVDDGQSPSGLSVAQQQQQMAGYPTQQQYHGHGQAHWYGSGAQSPNAPISQPSQQQSGYSSTFAGYSHHPHPAHAPARNPSMYAVPIPPTAPSQWASSGSTQGQEPYYHPGHPAYLQPVQGYQPQLPYTSPTHATGTYQVSTPAGSSSSGSGSFARPTPPMAPGTIPPSATVPLATRPHSSSVGSKGVAGPPGAVSAPSQVPHRGASGGIPVGTGPAAPVLMEQVIDVSGEDRFEHGPSEFPPKPYPGGEKAKSPWWPTRKTEKLYGSRLDQVRRTSFC